MCSPTALPDKSSAVSASSAGQGEEQKTAPQRMERKVSELQKDRPLPIDLSLLLEKEKGEFSDSDKLDEAFNQLHQQSTTLEPPIEQKEEKASKDKL